MNQHWVELRPLGAVAAVVGPPLGMMGLQSYLYSRSELSVWWAAEEKPHWAIANPGVHLALDLISPALLGLGAHIAISSTQDAALARVAAAAFGTTLASAATSAVVLTSSRHFAATTAAFATTAALSAATAVIFGRLSPAAGILAVPWTLWILHSTALFASLWRRKGTPPYEELEDNKSE